KQKQAQIPTMNSEAGGNMRPYCNGVMINRIAVVTEGEGLSPSLPSQLRSTQTPLRVSGMRFCWATMAPSGPSLEKCTSAGSKLLQKSAERLVARSIAAPRSGSRLNHVAQTAREPGANVDFVWTFSAI